MAKKIKVLDNVSGVEQIINVSSLASNGTITGTDLMLIEQSNTLKKVSITDLSAEFGGGGGGNTYTISLPFSKGGGNVNGSVTVPTNAILLNCWIKIEEELSTTGAPFLIRLDGSSPLLLGTQGTDFNEFVGAYQLINLLGSIATSDIESAYKVTSTDSGVLQANHSGSGFGSGIIYLQYSTELS